MSRQIDQACELEELHRRTALANFQAAKKNTPVSAFECEECSEKIPEARRIAVTGCRYCVECQEWLEKHGQA